MVEVGSLKIVIINKILMDKIHPGLGNIHAMVIKNYRHGNYTLKNNIFHFEVVRHNTFA